MSTMMSDEARIAAITGAAGAGFRLSLVLNAVKMKMQNADTEIQRISRAISDFSLMLKQVARTMEEGGVQPTPLAIDTVFDIKDHSEHIFEEIKGMTELAQKRDADGNLTEIGIGQKVVWSFKQPKVPYLLGQLDSLKLNLAIMLQVLQLAKVASPYKPRPTDRFMTQERAEIQNMIVLQHWSLEDLRTLFLNAQDDVRRDSTASNLSEDPPPKYEDPPSEEVRLAIAPPPRPPKETDTSQALVKYQEQPIQQLDESLHQALSRENQVLSAEVPDIVNHLLKEWTIPTYPSSMGYPRALTNGPIHPPRPRRHHATVSSEEGDSSDYDSSDSLRKGYYLEGPPPKPRGVKKQLRFEDQVKLQPRVDDESDEEDRRNRRRATTGRHILRSNASSDSDSDSDGSPPPNSHTRRPRPSSSESAQATHAAWDRNRRPYYNAPGGPRNSPPEKEAVRPLQRGSVSGPGNGGVPPSPHTGPMHMPHSALKNPQLRPPPGGHHYSHPGTGRPPSQGSGGPYVPQQSALSPNASPVMTHGTHFPQSQRGAPPMSPINAPQSGSGGFIPPMPAPGGRPRPSRGANSQHSSFEGKHVGWKDGPHPPRDRDSKKRDKDAASRNIKKGMTIGAAAAGLMELLSGLDGI